MYSLTALQPFQVSGWCPDFPGVWVSGFWRLTSGGPEGKTGVPAEFRIKVLDLLEEGRSVASVAYDLDVSDQTGTSARRAAERCKRPQPCVGARSEARSKSERWRVGLIRSSDTRGRLTCNRLSRRMTGRHG